MTHTHPNTIWFSQNRILRCWAVRLKSESYIFFELAFFNVDDLEMEVGEKNRREHKERRGDFRCFVVLNGKQQARFFFKLGNWQHICVKLFREKKLNLHRNYSYCFGWMLYVESSLLLWPYHVKLVLSLKYFCLFVLLPDIFIIYKKSF